MAPNATIIGHPATPMATHYGALDLEDKKSAPASRVVRSGLVIAACLVVMVTLGVFSLTSGTAENTAASVINQENAAIVKSNWQAKAKEMGLVIEQPAHGDDCHCAGPCSPDRDANGLHYCPVSADVVLGSCVGTATAPTCDTTASSSDGYDAFYGATCPPGCTAGVDTSGAATCTGTATTPTCDMESATDPVLVDSLGAATCPQGCSYTFVASPMAKCVGIDDLTYLQDRSYLSTSSDCGVKTPIGVNALMTLAVSTNYCTDACAAQVNPTQTTCTAVAGCTWTSSTSTCARTGSTPTTCVGASNTDCTAANGCKLFQAGSAANTAATTYPDSLSRTTGNCRVACDWDEGRYDCWSFPCKHGFCVDGQETYTCHCDAGYDGPSCENDVDECMFIDDESGTELAACHEKALCTNNDGKYECECNAGWEGDGYRATGTLAAWTPASCTGTATDTTYTCDLLASTASSAVCSANMGCAADCPAGCTLKAETRSTPQPPTWIETIRRPSGTQAAGYIEACRDVDDCNPQPCKNGATCENLEGIPNGYNCHCPLGLTGEASWVGHDCETNVDECDPADPKHDCDANADCVDLEGSFKCMCHEHWQPIDTNGVNREGRLFLVGGELVGPGCYDVPDCANDKPCQHGGTCTEGPDGCAEVDAEGNTIIVNCYSCTCAYGWTGYDCEIDENECNGSEDGEYLTVRESCHDEAFCTNTPGSFECACNAGWTGDGITCIDADDCEFSPCAHGGTCYDCGTLCFTCACVVGWRGTTCATDWNECLMGIHTCSDKATCINNPGSYDCRCDPGFEGNGFGYDDYSKTTRYLVGSTVVTETKWYGCHNIDDCNPDLYGGATVAPNGPCVMGTCSDDPDLGNQYYCVCQVGYTDAQCQTNINECDPILGDNDCHRFATCTDTTGSYTCQCNTGFTGNGVSACLDVSDCYSQCKHGFCSDLGVGHYKCTCDDGWMDKHCDEDINECVTYTHECARHALCTNSDGSYSCACNKGWSGDGLSQGTGCMDIDDCASNPCDFGECEDQGASSYTCTCQEGFTDFNCDFDVNECYMKTHTCHVDARCVNIPGGFFCRCLSGYEGDGRTCTDLDDCDPDPCDPIHGTCEDRGANLYECECMAGWTGVECGDDCDECDPESGCANGCDPNALCSNTYGSHQCACKNEFYGDGTLCTQCTQCTAGWKPEGVCDVIDRSCVNVDECVEEVDNCDENATCLDNQGSFKCECDQNGPGDEWWGIGTSDDGVTPGCAACTECRMGFHEIEPCTSTTDRTCEINVADGLYMIESEADDNRMCVAMMNGEWFPSRMNWGNGDEYCGIAGETTDEKRTELLGDGQAIFKLTHVGKNNVQEDRRFQDQYLIEFDDGEGYRCLFFGDKGKDIYPSLQNCHSFDIADKGSCPWANGGKGLDFCGFNKEGMDAKTAIFENGQAIWRIVPLKMNENKYLLMSASKGRKEQDGRGIWECLAFENNGAATNPSRYNWGNGGAYCGAGNWEGEGQIVALLNNKQAVFILTFLQGA